MDCMSNDRKDAQASFLFCRNGKIRRFWKNYLWEVRDIDTIDSVGGQVKQKDQERLCM